MTLRSLAQELTESHLKMRDGQVVKRPSALNELRAAISHSTSGGGESSGGKPLPLDGTALSMLMNIERMAGEDHLNRYGEQYFGTIEGLLTKIGKDDHEGEWRHWFNKIFQQWIDEIEALIRPTKVRRLDGTPCPACGQSMHGTERETNLIINCYQPGTKDLRKIQDWTMECRGCSAKWEGEGMKFIVAILNA